MARERAHCIFAELSEDLARTTANSFKRVLCPLCLQVYSEDAIDLEEPELTEEHIIPESLGGKLVTLSCKSCNSTYGSKLDSHLVQMVRSQDSLAFRSSRYRYAHPATRWCGRGRNILSQEFLGKYSHRIFAGIGHWLKKLHRTLPRLSSKTTVIDQRNLEFLGGHRALGRPCRPRAKLWPKSGAADASWNGFLIFLYAE